MEDPGECRSAGPEDGPTGLQLAAFDLVTEATRAAILETLAARQAARPTDPWMGFSELREAAGVEDSGNFNYHLERLQPAYVRRGEAGYALTYAGLSLVGRLRAGLGAETVRGPEELDATCDICDTRLTVRYEDARLSVACPNGHTYPEDYLPPRAVADRSLREAAAIQRRRTLHDCELVREGVCPACFDTLEREHRVTDASQASHLLVGTCGGCGRVSSAPLGLYLLREPAVVAFYHDHGVDVTDTPLWALDLVIAEPTVRSETPLRLALSVEEDGERLTLVVDEYARLRHSERSAVAADP